MRNGAALAVLAVTALLGASPASADDRNIACNAAQELVHVSADSLIAIRNAENGTLGNHSTYVADAAEYAFDRLSKDGWPDHVLRSVKSLEDAGRSGFDLESGDLIYEETMALVFEGYSRCPDTDFDFLADPAAPDPRLCATVDDLLSEIADDRPIIEGEPGARPVFLLAAAADDAERASNLLLGGHWDDEAVSNAQAIADTLRALAAEGGAAGKFAEIVQLAQPLADAFYASCSLRDRDWAGTFPQ
ncbi:MAG: hypothetical protein H6873_02645 [Hyphomicrobiaceae bacterium]|nr:hypothetical protein [Hyphomicrobiaceae bacterium]